MKGIYRAFRQKLMVDCGVYFLDSSTLLLFDNWTDINYILPEGSSDEDYIKHLISTRTVGYKISVVTKLKKTHKHSVFKRSSYQRL